MQVIGHRCSADFPSVVDIMYSTQLPGYLYHFFIAVSDARPVLTADHTEVFPGMRYGFTKVISVAGLLPVVLWGGLAQRKQRRAAISEGLSPLSWRLSGGIEL